MRLLYGICTYEGGDLLLRDDIYCICVTDSDSVKIRRDNSLLPIAISRITYDDVQNVLCFNICNAYEGTDYATVAMYSCGIKNYICCASGFYNRAGIRNIIETIEESPVTVHILRQYKLRNITLKEV